MLALVTDRARWAVATYERQIITKRQELGLDRVYQGIVVAVLEVGAADRTAEQDIADEREAMLGIDVDQRARRVPWAVMDIER